jgi:twitching motility protein PilT
LLNLKSLLQILADSNGSDVHLKAGAPPVIRVDGELHRLEGRNLTPEDTAYIAQSILPPDRKEGLKEKRELDFALSLPGVGRFRVNVFYQRGSVSLVLRRVQLGSTSFEQLGLPPVIRELAGSPRGLCLVTGPTGSGKTTTLAAMIDHINETRPVHVLTIEDPIEILHSDRVATINQREVGIDTESFHVAMRAAMRQDPDVILIGEMRDTETVQAALAAAETGHMVFSTLHTSDAVETVNRVVDFFPAQQQHQIRVTLASTIRGVICQRLVPRVGGGMAPAVEVMVANGRIAERIIDPETTSDIHDIVARGSSYGMQTFDQALLKLVQEETVTVEDALAVSSSPHDFTLMLQQARIAIGGMLVPA